MAGKQTPNQRMTTQRLTTKGTDWRRPFVLGLCVSLISASDSLGYQAPTTELPETRVEAEPSVDPNAVPTVPPIMPMDAGSGGDFELPPLASSGSSNQSSPTLPITLAPPNDPFEYSGSPLNAFGLPTTIATGVPQTNFNIPRALTIKDQSRLNQEAPTATPEMLEMIPGVLIQRTSTAGGSLIIRGANGNRNLIMVDGIPINDSGWRFNNIQYLNTIDPGIIDRVEVIRGPATVLYGSGALGGALNIVTKSRNDYSQSFGADGGVITRYGSANNDAYNRVQVSGNVQRFGLYTGGSYYTTGDLEAGEGVVFTNTNYDQGAADIRLDYLMENDWVATLDYQYFRQFRTPRTDNFARGRPTYFSPQQRDFGYLRFARFDDSDDLFHGLQATFSLQQRKEGTEELNQSLTQQTNAQDLVTFWGVDLRAISTPADWTTFTYGFTYYGEALQSHRQRGPVNGPFDPITPQLPPDGAYTQIGVFFLDEITMTDWWTINTGVRYSHVNASGTASADSDDAEFFQRSFPNWSFEVSSIVALTDTVHAFGSIAEGYRAPNLDDLASSDLSTAVGPDTGTTNLEPEELISYEAGLKFYGPYFEASGSYFYGDYYRQIVRTRNQSNTGNVRANSQGAVQGTEVDAVVFLLPNWTAYTAGSYLFGEDFTFNESLRVPPAFITIGSRWTIPRYGIFIEVWEEMMAAYDRLNSTDRQDARVPANGEAAWQTTNVRAGIDLEQYGQLSLNFYNLFDQNYRIIGSGVDAPGFEVQLGYLLNF